MEELLTQNLPSPQEGMPMPGMGQGMDQGMNPEMEQDEDYMRRDLVLCHISAHEASQLDYWQGGEMIDPETEFRTYPRLRDMMEKPAMQEFLQHLAEEIEQNGHADSNVEKITKSLPKDKLSAPFRPAPGDFTDEGIRLDADGEAAIHGDDETVFLPIKLADMLDEVRGEQIRNPEDGLRQYGFLNEIKKGLGQVINLPRAIVKETVRGVSNVTGIKRTHLNEFIRTAATVAGYAMYGPLGAAGGNALGNWHTGADLKKSLMRGAKVGAATYVAQGAAGGGWGMGNAANPTYLGLTGSGTAAVAPALATPAAITTPVAATTPAALTAPAALTPPAAASSAFKASSLINPALLAGGAYMMLKGKKQDDKAAKEARDDHRREIEEYRKQYGFDTPLNTNMNYDVTPNTDVQSQEDFERGRYHPINKYTSRYAKGGQVHGEDLLPGEEYLQKSKLIVGKGKGQDDKIPTNVPENTHIWDAASVSSLGDGSTKAGARILDMVTREAEKLAPKFKHKIKMSKARVPTMLSDGEYAMTPLTMHVLGHGDSEVGSKRVDKVRKELRAIKAKSGGKIPAKTPSSVFRHLPIPTKHLLKSV